MVRRFSLVAAVAFGALSITIGGATAATLVQVTPTTPNGWGFTISGGTAGFEAGLGTPPLGSGSAFFTAPTGADFSRLRTTAYDGVLLNSLTSLDYWTNVHANQNCQAPFISLNLDTDGDGVVDDQLNFEPCYQTGGYVTMPGAGPFADQCTDTNTLCFPKDEWVHWNAFDGGWWASSDNNGGPPLDSIATYLADHPSARIMGTSSYQATVQQPINSANTSNWPSKSKGAIPVKFKLASSSAGGFRIAAGNGWIGFDGNADALTVGVGGNETTYDFDGVGSGPVAGALAPTCSLPPATIRITKVSGTSTGEINEVAATYAGDYGQDFRVVDCMYQYNLSIPSLRGSGGYTVEILIDGDPVGIAGFDLK